MTLSAENPIELLGRPAFNVEWARRALLTNVWCWDQHKLRTSGPGPHRFVSDVWVRCLDWWTMRENPAAFNEPHASVWYDITNDLPALRVLAEDVVRMVQGVELGGVLITKIPAGTNVLPHIDMGWHARHYEKFAVQLQAHELQEFCFATKRLVTQAGDLFTFDNRYTHWVTNPSDEDRITMICCIRRES